ncbi:MAG: NAD(P)-dependent glycerol-3-phosphate dehydrogenase [Bifidobacteriaceae bacterium]|jgi:glycerol-3-phosphate dehydrogenase (NAD(P)+)|nr:NAD(P)-dependent glycerol-3-phosphate dehydrogenase [Bifidobacteriaceae bacterium]
MIKKVTLIGGGAWGSVFANILTENFPRVLVWDIEKAIVDEMNTKHTHKRHPNKKFSSKIYATTSLQEAADNADILFICISSQYLRDVVRQLKPFIKNKTIVVSLTKGIEVKTNKVMTQIIKEELIIDNDKVAAISGPNLSDELFDKKPAATVVASKSNETIKLVSQAITCNYFRPFASSDILGVQLCGALKNVIALAIGMAQGRNYGFNTQSTVISRGLEEIMRLGVSMDAQAKTFYGLAGIGDLIATCMSPNSRNHAFGLAIGQGHSFQEAKTLSNGVAEGCMTTVAALELAKEFLVPMPIVAGIHKILFNNADVDSLETRLMNLPLYTEGINSAKVS